MALLFCETPGIPTHSEKSASALATAHENANKIVFLTSQAMSGTTIFMNGLYQNVFILYELIENLGYKPIILTDKRLEDVSGAGDLFNGIRTTDVDTFFKAPYNIHHVIEVAVGHIPLTRKMFRRFGARVTKLYLGNILNIDIELPTFIPGHNISHHIAGELDEIWTSPHYAPNVDYGGVINGDASQPWPPSRIVPYVWSPRFIKDATSFAGFNDAAIYGFTIIEPNISFQKCHLIPLLIIEALYRSNPEAVREVIVISDRATASTYFQAVIRPRLHLVRDGKVHFEKRHTIIEVTKKWPHNIVVGNQILNEYNYIMMEHLHLGFPYVHNCASLRDYGYYYEGTDIDSGEEAIRRAFNHDRRRGAARAEAAQLAWRFSPNNPEILSGWSELLKHKE